jgi:RNA recognition motif-containing protein
MSTEQSSQSRVFVGGVNKGTSRDSLMQCLDRYGAVRELFYPVDKLGHFKGFAFVTYEDVDG